MKIVCHKIVCILFITFFFISCKELNQEDIEGIIAKSEKLTQLDRFCTELPKPTRFNFVYKQFGSNSEASYISYRYQTHLSFFEVSNFYIDYFEKKGWHRDKDNPTTKGFVKYRNGKQTVSLEHVSFPNVNYSLGCGQER